MATASPWAGKRQLAAFLLLAILFFFISGVSAEEECNSNKPCKQGCCSKFGFCGYGKDYCSKDVCVNNCDSKAQCDPGGFGSDFVEKSTCPLNVCCSKYGFCGTDAKFCGDKKVNRPTCPLSGLTGMHRVVGYYESWSPARPCNTFYPEQIPLGVYTHLNFAFATINPKTYELELGSSMDEDLLSRLAKLKDFDPDLHVFVAVGGWTFNDPGPTAKVFSDIARSDENSDKFIKSVIRIITAYNLDGIDLDWEYPGAEDRSGRKEDFKNFPVFLKKLKSALKVTGGRDGVSITLPASFWYLQHFDIKEIQKHVDFMNMMTYDFHGTWDMGNKWVGPYLNAHTNLTEIEQALDLLWRNDIESGKVVLGMAFYGRAFTVSSASCTAPGCTYASGGERLTCSGEVSVALNSEIVDIMAKTGAKPTLDEAAAVQILNYGNNQWVSYDDETTLEIRVGFARKSCLGGVMVWAVSHDTPDGTFSLAVGRASKRKASFVNSLLLKAGQGDGYSYKVNKQPQCMWTNCLENCPSGWIRMKREDGGARSGEYMVSEQSCNGHGMRQLCCPPGHALFDCGWYNHHNGKCKGNEIPSTHLEIASTNAHCRSGYQAASCSVAMEAMRLWNTCIWTKRFPDCNQGSCSDFSGAGVNLFSSGSGSGGSYCSGSQKKKYCCNRDHTNIQWGQCDWYENAGVLPSKMPNGQCMGGCPNDRYTVSLENKGGSCKTGARAMCCENGYQTVEKRLSSVDEEFDYMLKQFLTKATCTKDTSSMVYMAQEIIIKNLEKIMYGDATKSTRDVWDDQVKLHFKFLTAANIATWAKKDGAAIRRGNEGFPRQLLCALNFYNAQIGGGSTMQCECERENCCTNNLCPRDGASTLRRSLEDTVMRYNVSFTEEDAEGGFDFSLYKRDGDLEPREVYDWKAWSPWVNGDVYGSYSSINYPSIGKWDANDDIWSRAIDFISKSCTDLGVSKVALSKSARSNFVTEHIFERQAIKSLIITTLSGILPSEAQSKYAPLDPSFWTSIMAEPDTTRVGITSKGTSTRMEHLMNALGSTWNRNVFVLACYPINKMKLQLWRQARNPAGDLAKMRKDTKSASKYVNAVRQLISALAYLNNPIVLRLLLVIVQDLKSELGFAEAVYFAANNVHLDMAGRFNEWFIDYLSSQQTTVTQLIMAEATEAPKVWGPITGSGSSLVLEVISLAKDYMDDFAFDKAMKAAVGWS